MGGTNSTKTTNDTERLFGSTTGNTFGNTTGNTTGNTLGTTTGAVTPYNSQLLGDLYSRLGVQPTDLSGPESNAIGTLTSIGAGGNPFAPQIGNVADTLLAGGGPDRSGIATDAYNGLLSRLTPTANGDFLDPNKNPFFARTTSTIGDDVTKRLESLYAGSGRDPAGAGGGFGQAVARGISEGTAPVFANVYQGERANQLGAANQLYGAGTTQTGLLSSLDQTRLANQQAGIGAAGAANSASTWGPMTVLAAQAQARGIPMNSILQQIQALLPASQAFGQHTGATTGTTAGQTSGQTIGQTSGTSNQFGTGQQVQDTSTPFNPASLLPLAFLPMSGGTSLGGSLLSSAGGGLFSSLTNGFRPGAY